MKLYHIAVRNLTRNASRSILSMTAIAVATASIVFLFSFLEGLKRDLAENLQTFYTGQVRIQHKDYRKYEYLYPLHLRIENAGRVMTEIESNRSVGLISPRIPFPAGIYLKEETHQAAGIGVDFTREKAFQDLESRLLAGRIPENGRNQALLGFELAEELGLKIGDKITVLSTTMSRGVNAVTFLISGLVRFPVPALNKSWLLAPLDRVQRLLGMGDSVTEILVKLKGGSPSRQTAAMLEEALHETGRVELAASSWEQDSTSYGWLKMAGTSYSFIALFFFILASSVIVNTIMMVVFERVREIGTIGALGMTGAEIVRLFFLEALYLSGIGSAVGVLLGIGVTIPLSAVGLDLSSAMQGVSFEVSNRIYPAISIKSTVVVFLFANAVASLVSLIPSSKAARLQPADALKDG